MRVVHRKGKWIGLAFLLPSLIGLCIFYLLPFLMSFFYIFTQGITEIRFVWFQNFVDLFHNPVFILAVKSTGLFLVLGVPGLVAAALFVSFLLRARKASLERWALLAPMAVPVSTFLLGFRGIFGESGMVNILLESLCLDTVDFFGKAYAMPVLLGLYLMKNLGYMTVILTSAMSALPQEYQEAFALDSNSKLCYLWRVLLPMIAPMVFFVVVISVMNALKIFREVYVLYGNSPPDSVYMLQSFMNNNFFKLNYQRLSTAALLVIAGLSAFIWGFLWLQNRVNGDD